MPDAAALLAEYRDRVMRQYGQAVGRRREDLVTPALVLDIDAAQRNIDRMASELRRIGPTTIRPHYKTHKSPDLARRQVQAGASGLSMATVWEAAVLAADGFDDLFVVNTVAHPDKIRAAGRARQGPQDPGRGRRPGGGGSAVRGRGPGGLDGRHLHRGRHGHEPMRGRHRGRSAGTGPRR